MLRKRLVSAVIALPVFGASMGFAGSPAQQGANQSSTQQQSALPAVLQLKGATNNSLEQLRSTCIELRSNEQIKAFNMKLLCNVTYETVSTKFGEVQLANSATLSSQVSIKGATTDEQVFASEAASQKISCPIYTKELVSGPAGGVLVSLTSCEQIELDTLRNLCKSETKEICSASSIVSVGQQSQQSQQAQAQQAQQQQAPAGAHCTKQVVEVINTCEDY